jgi:hypothetical protein
LSLLCGVAAGPAFTLAYLIEGVTRGGEGYSAWRHPVSSLSLGRYGWTQVANFLLSGGLLVAFGVGARRDDVGSTWLPRLIGTIGVGLIGAGAFRCDPLSGYPPGSPAVPAPASKPGVLHVLFSALVFLGMPVAFVLEARRGEPFWAPYSKASCLGFIAAFGVARAGFAQVPGFVGVGGLFQRISLSVGFAWLTLRAADLLRRLPET